MNKQWVKNDLGILIEEEIKFEKREQMTRDEWRAYFAQEEITEEQFRDEYCIYKRPLDS